MTKSHPKRPYLRVWRENLGWTQQSLANAIGTSHSTVQRQETGVLGVDDATFEAIARVYGITQAELSAHPRDAEKAKELARLLATVRTLDAGSIRTLADLSAKLANRGS